MATKNITVTGSMNTSADLAALVAGGDISITGQGTTTSSFQGLILAEGSFKAKDTTLIGSALTLDKNGSVQLERVRTVAARDLTKVDLSYPVELKEAAKGNFSTQNGGFGSKVEYGISYLGKFTAFTLENVDAIQSIVQASKSSGNSIAVGVYKDDKLIQPGEPDYDSLDPAIKLDFSGASDHFKTFRDQVNEGKVIYENVFQLDFNKFLKTKGGLRPLIQRVIPL